MRDIHIDLCKNTKHTLCDLAQTIGIKSSGKMKKADLCALLNSLIIFE